MKNKFNVKAAKSSSRARNRSKNQTNQNKENSNSFESNPFVDEKEYVDNPFGNPQDETKQLHSEKSVNPKEPAKALQFEKKNQNTAPSIFSSSIHSPMLVHTPLGIIANVYFGENDFILNSPNFQVIQSLVTALESLPNPQIIVNGFASSEGEASQNLSLSDQRRNMVISLLNMSRRNRPLNISGQALGEEQLAVEEKGNSQEIAAARNQNRRVEIQILHGTENRQNTSPNPALNAVEQGLNLKLTPDYLQRLLEEIKFPPLPPKKPLTPPVYSEVTPRPGTVQDLLQAVLKIPTVGQALDRLKARALSRLHLDWQELSTGRKAAVITQSAIITGAALTGALAHPQTREDILNLIDGQDIPIPRTPLKIKPLIRDQGVVFTLDIGKLFQ